MDVIESVMRYLDGLGHLSLAAPVNAFEGRMPTAPDEALSIRGTGGPEGNRKHAYDFPTFQIRVRGARGADPRPTKQWLKDIYGGSNLRHAPPSSRLPTEREPFRTRLGF